MKMLKFEDADVKKSNTYFDLFCRLLKLKLLNMKIIINTLCLIVIASISYSQITYTSNCTITPAIEKLYRVDAMRLSIARLQETNNPYKDSIEVPQNVYDSIMRVFVIMHNMQNSSIKDTIKNLFQFENFTIISQPHYDDSYEKDSTHISLVATGVFGVSYRDRTKPNIFEVHIDSNILWAKDWASGNITNTSNLLMNQFMQQYDFSITKLPYTFFGQYFFNLKTSMVKNINALSKAMPSYSSFAYVQPLAYIGDGNIINFEFKNAGILATYHNGCGDCLSGCTYWEDWQFFIPYDSCNANFIGLVNVRPNLLTGAVGCLRGVLITPIEFGNVSAIKQGEQNQINFTALIEVNIKNYEIQRSSNAAEFYTINTITANNKNNSSYTVTDKNPLSGNNYYRVKAIENDGKTKYSKIVLVKNEEVQLNIYPNPAKDFIIIECKGAKQLLIIDYLGRTIKQLNNVTEHQTINTKQFTRGVYLVQIININGETKTRKVVVE